ncbi:MAG: DUF1553 domain-containing protein [Pirellulaceae bacterium]|nr:DUF1553 domain-containing protein [Pirellulaceae bacterium]
MIFRCGIVWMWLAGAILLAGQLRAQDADAVGSGLPFGDGSGHEAGEAGVERLRPVELTFDNDIQPLLTRFGCNAGACHGKSRGQNGFALSLLGFDSDFDYSAIVLQARGRRVQFTSPENSLLLRKATGQEPHEGGVRFDVDSPHYEMFHSWIAQGAPRTPETAPRLIRVRVEPPECSLSAGQSQSLTVWAEYSDGSQREVTDATAFDSNDRNIVDVSATGMLQAGDLPGETAVMARYMNHIAVCGITIPLPNPAPPEVYASLPSNGEIDRLVHEKLRLLGILPSDPALPSTLVRRTYLRLIGRLPTADEARQYLADPHPDRQSNLVDALLQRPEYADFWANKWADLLRPNPYRVGMKAVLNMDAWLRRAFRENWPYDQFVTELVTAQGSTWHNGATVLYRDRPQTVEVASSISQLFLGIRLECAKCHHHPFEVWSQDDFYGFAAFFARVGRKGTGLSPPISGSEEMIFSAASGKLVHERTGEVVKPKTLTGDPLELGPDDDPRQLLAAWMTSASNRHFPSVMVNRVWAELMGVGLVDPVDDLRATNPASNQPLLDYLANEFRGQGFDIKQLIRLIATSATFARSSHPSTNNVADTRNFSRYYRQRMRAESLLDAVNDVLGTEEKLAALPPGSRAMQLWTHRTPSLFLDTFGRPDENLDPPYERSYELTTPQILHLMNSKAVHEKISHDEGRLAALAAGLLASQEVVEELYLCFYSRPPNETELSVAMKLFPAETSTSRRQAVEDLAWALLNGPEFYFID